MRTTISDLRAEVNALNRKYKFTDRTDFKFGIHQAYGGYQVVLYRQRSFKGGYTNKVITREITNGYQSPRDTINDLQFRDIDGIVKFCRKNLREERRWKRENNPVSKAK